MEKRKKSLFIDLPPVKLYLNDVRDIIDIFKDSNCKNVYLQTSEYNVMDFEELKKVLNKTEHYLKIGCNLPYVELELNSYNARFYASEDSTINRGILAKIEVILKRNNRLIYKILNWNWMPTILGIIISSSVPSLLKFVHSSISLVISLLSISVFIVYLIYFLRVGANTYSIIEPVEKHENKNFFTRNRDRLLVGILIAIVSSLLTLLIAKLTD